jgi:hypothetical protein
MDSPSSSRSDNVRRLLNQRAAAHTWASVSELSDSPSVYSHQFSPRTYPTPTQNSSTYATPLNMSARSQSPPHSPLFDRQRLDDPSLSGLDLSDPRFSYASRDSWVSEDDSYHHGAERERDSRIMDETSEEDSASHVSFLGPKMKIHAPAPWEMNDDTEADSDGSTQTHTTTRSHAFKAKTRTDGFIKGLGFVSRASTDTRPSTDSSRSGSDSQGKASFDTVGSHGALR